MDNTQSQTTCKPDVKELYPEELTALLIAQGIPAFRSRQLFDWLHRRVVTEFPAMDNLPAALRATLAEHYILTTLQAAQEERARDGTTRTLFQLTDGLSIETVAIPEKERVTVCVSTQVGCPFGCVFCVTGQSGFTRNLRAAEIIEQVYRMQASLPEGRRVTNVVYMGMGEPLANYDAVLRSVRLLIHPQGLNLAQRHVTLSTVGNTPGIERLTGEGLQVNLAISLHSPTQEGRLRLLPIANTYALTGLMTAVRQYVRHTGRKVTFEYTVAPGRNDREEDAAGLAELLRGLQAMVNVIPLNPGATLPRDLQLAPEVLLAAAERFTALLQRRHVEAALRRSRGQEVSGACGQLRGRRKDEGGRQKAEG